MAKYTGYVQVAHNSYDAWRNATNGNGYDVDGSYGCQCWDFASLFWWNVGFPTGYPHITGTPGKAYTMWDLRDQNKSYNGTDYFDIIYNLQDVKRGDIMVFNYTAYNEYGHVGFADVDYSSWTPDPNQPYEFPVLSENNQGTPDPAGGAYVNVHGYDIRLFLGAFRYKGWIIPPTPPTPTSEGNFKFVLWARKIRDRKNVIY